MTYLVIQKKNVLTTYYVPRWILNNVNTIVNKRLSVALKEINLIWEVRNEQLNYNSIKLRFCKIKGIVVSSRSIEQHLTLLWEVKEGFPKEVMAQLSPKRLIEVSQAKEEGRMYWDEQVSKGSGVESGRVSPGGLLPK